MIRWARPPIPRDQLVLFPHRLEDAVAEDHPVRLFDEMLRAQDWSGWEEEYVLVKGQPPIHPRVVGSVILYGMSLGMRSSRRLEYACGNNVDFIWLTEGRHMDHSTICGFRTRFTPQLKALFRGVGRTAMALDLARLNLVALDGTRVQANSSRHATASRKTLEERLAVLDEQIERMFAEAQRADEVERDLFGEAASPTHLPRELADLRRRQERLRKALEAVKAKEAKAEQNKKKEKGSGQAATASEDAGEPHEEKAHQGRPASERPEAGAGSGQSQEKETAGSDDDGGSERTPRVPVADPECTIQPNKDGGYAPNYTPLAATDAHGGFVLEAEVLPDSDEGAATVSMVDGVKEGHGEHPEEFLADTAHGSGPNLAALEARGIEAYIPLEQRADHGANPAHRDDPSQPVAEADWGKLPRDARTKKLDRSAFVYDAERDCYWCPMGHRLGFARTQKKQRRKGVVVYRLYRRSEGCGGCPLRGACVKSQKGTRTVFRGEHEELREAMEARLSTAEGRATYSRRKWAAETPFGYIKTRMNFRRFLLRGLEKVRMEWLWACTAYNLMKLVRALSGSAELLAGFRA